MDESMAPHRVTHNAQFCFMPRKPHPYDIKFECLADEDNYYLKFNYHKRTNEELEKPILMKGKFSELNREELGLASPKTVLEIVNFLVEDLKPGHIIVADRWFSNLDISTTLKNLGHDSILKCQNNRPTALWKKVQEITENEKGFKLAKAQNETGNTIYCYSKKCEDSSSYENILTTLDLKNYVERKMKSVNSEGERVERRSTHPEVHNIYNRASSFVDEANRSVMSCYWSHRVYHYQVAIQIFLLTALAHNARVLYNLESGMNISQVEYLKKISNELAPVEEKQDQTHELRERENGKRVSCTLCYRTQRNKGIAFKWIKRKKTRFFCTGCKIDICEECFNSFEHGISANL
jgi:hypothetical protein